MPIWKMYATAEWRRLLRITPRWLRYCASKGRLRARKPLLVDGCMDVRWVLGVRCQTVIMRDMMREWDHHGLISFCCVAWLGVEVRSIDCFLFETSLRVSQTGSLNLHSVRRKAVRAMTRDTRAGLDVTRNILFAQPEALSLFTFLEHFYCVHVLGRHLLSTHTPPLLTSHRAWRGTWRCPDAPPWH